MDKIENFWQNLFKRKKKKRSGEGGEGGENKENIELNQQKKYDSTHKGNFNYIYCQVVMIVLIIIS